MKGLKFTPTPEPNTKELKSDLQEFGRRLRLLEHFNGQHQQDESIVKPRSNFVPPKSNDRLLDMFIDTVTQYHEKMPTPKNVKNNLSKAEKKALENLKNDKSIIIKEADKAKAVP